MSAAMPQDVADRVFAFMAAEKYGRIELIFQAGRLTGLKISEHVHVGADERLSPAPLDDPAPKPQDSET